MIFSTLTRLRRDQQGATAAMIAVLFLVVFSVTAFVVDISKIAAVRNRAQHALDAAGLAATESADEIDVRQEANNFFTTNYGAGYLGATFSPVNVTVSGDGNVYDYSVTGFIPFSIAQIFSPRAGQQILVTTQVRRDNSLLELALVMDTSSAMGQAVGGGGASRLDTMKGSAKGLLDRVYRGANTLPGTVVSLISYSDAVRINPNVSNNWLRNPYPNPAIFDGCMSNRRNGFDLTDQPPQGGNVDTLFPRYSGPFDVPNKVQVNFTPVDKPQISIPYVTQETGDGIRVIFVANFNTVYGGGRFTSEIDYVSTNAAGAGVFRPEILWVDFGADYVKSFPDMKISNMYINEQGYKLNCDVEAIPPERGRWDAYNAAGQLVGTNTFFGAINGALFSTATVSALFPFRYVFIYPTDNGDTNHFVGACGEGNVVPGITRDNSDFTIYEFTHKPQCSLQMASFFMSDRGAMNSYIDSLQAAGPVRNNVGMSYGWYALSQRWRGVIVPGVNTLPRNNQPGVRKIAVLLTQGRNFDPAQDDANFAATCTAMKAQNISIYTISFDVSDPAVSSLLRNCANPGQYFNAPSAAALNQAFNDIGNAIARLRITK